jgi:hypothetical protein
MGIPIKTARAENVLVADRIWIATALLHRQFPQRRDFTKDEIRRKLTEEGLHEGAKEGSINAHLKEHCVANVMPSSGKYRMLFETSPGNLRLFRSGDEAHWARIQPRKPSKSIPKRDEIPPRYQPLLDWYESWNGGSAGSTNPPDSSPTAPSASARWQDDPLIRLIGSGKHIWADEHAD